MRIYLIVLYSLFSLGLCAQEEARIYGRVSDQQSLLPIDYATVYIDGTTISAETDRGGNFSLDVPTGKSMVLKCRGSVIDPPLCR